MLEQTEERNNDLYVLPKLDRPGSRETVNIDPFHERKIQDPNTPKSPLHAAKGRTTPEEKNRSIQAGTLELKFYPAACNLAIRYNFKLNY